MLRLLLTSLKRRSPQAGLTLVESMVAMTIISIMAVVTTPPLILSMANRIQNRRTETAMNLAQKEIERIRLIMDKGGYEEYHIPPVGKVPGGMNSIDEIIKVTPPTRISNKQPCGIPADDSCDKDPNYKKAWWSESEEFFIQTFRSPGYGPCGSIGAECEEGDCEEEPTGGGGGGEEDGVPVAFRMGVRVYSKAAYEDLGSLQTHVAPLYLSTGAGENVAIQKKGGTTINAKQRQFPLAAIYADFTRGDLVGSLDKYYELINFCYIPEEAEPEIVE